MPIIYTSGQVSKICNVAASTVNKWFDSGRLKGYRVPGSRHRRIPRERLIEFMECHGMPLDVLSEAAAKQVLVVAVDRDTIDCLQREMGEDSKFQLVRAASGFEAGMAAESVMPECVIVDFGIGQFDALQICRNLRRRPALSHVMIIALLPNNRQLSVLENALVDDQFRKPVDAALISQRIRTMLTRAG